MGSCILYIDDEIEYCIGNMANSFNQKNYGRKHNDIWKMFFDRSSSKEDLGEGIILIFPSNEVISFPYKLEFATTRNVVEY